MLKTTSRQHNAMAGNRLPSPFMHTIAVLALPGVVPFDLATPIDTFGRARLSDGRNAYRIRVCAPEAQAPVPSETFTITAPHGLDALAAADTVVVPGCDEHAPPPAPEVLSALRHAADQGTRIASICAGAFILAAAGLLDGLGATT